MGGGSLFIFLVPPCLDRGSGIEDRATGEMQGTGGRTAVLSREDFRWWCENVATTVRCLRPAPKDSGAIHGALRAAGPRPPGD